MIYIMFTVTYGSSPAFRKAPVVRVRIFYHFLPLHPYTLVSRQRIGLMAASRVCLGISPTNFLWTRPSRSTIKAVGIP